MQLPPRYSALQILAAGSSLQLCMALRDQVCLRYCLLLALLLLRCVIVASRTGAVTYTSSIWFSGRGPSTSFANTGCNTCALNTPQIVPIRVHPHNRAVAHIRIQIQALWIAKLSVGNRRRFSRPIGTHESASNVCIISGAEVVQLRFGIPFLAGELVMVVAGRGAPTGNDSAPGIEVIVVEHCGVFVDEHRRRVQVIGDVVLDVRGIR